MSRVPTLSSPFLLGFDDIERALDRVAKAATDGAGIVFKQGFPDNAANIIFTQDGAVENMGHVRPVYW